MRRDASLLLAMALALLATSVSAQDVEFITTPMPVVERMLELAGLEEGERLIDLGSGDGRIVIQAAHHGAQARGVEIDPDLVRLAKERAREAGVASQTDFVAGDIFETDFSDTDVLTLYLLPDLNLRLRDDILNMRPGTRVVSHDFDMADWRPDVHDVVDRSDIYLWIVPANVDGEWSLTLDDGRQLELSLTQSFQDIHGEVRVDEHKSLPLEATRLEGATVRFALDFSEGRVYFHGIVDGETIVPDKVAYERYYSSEAPDWSAARAP